MTHFKLHVEDPETAEFWGKKTLGWVKEIVKNGYFGSNDNPIFLLCQQILLTGQSGEEAVTLGWAGGGFWVDDGDMVHYFYNRTTENSAFFERTQGGCVEGSEFWVQGVAFCCYQSWPMGEGPENSDLLDAVATIKALEELYPNDHGQLRIEVIC